ncbi:hypothetical protein OAE97_00025 [Verrucomicrobia bacterium]|nr:hypothetical protein [Verrucomicrobiota bacterium]
MRIKLKNTPEQVELIKALGSKNRLVAAEASEAFAAFLGPVIQRVIQQAGTASAVYTDAPFDENDSPSYPLDLYYNEFANGYVSVWSQTLAGGLPNAQDVSAVQEVKIATYRLDSAVSINKRYARQARLDVIAKLVERMSQEVLVKQERNAWAVLLKALGEASTTPSGGTALKHYTEAGTLTEFKLDDLNKLMTRVKRINESWAGGTPADPYSTGLTDLYVSPEIKEKIRAFAYNPLNTVGGVRTTGGGSDTSTDSSIALPDGMREDIYRNAGMQEIYGVNIVELIELGLSKKYNVLFDNYITTIPTGAAFNPATHQILVGVDNSKGALIRPIATNSETGGSFTVQPDDQFLQRTDKTGFYGAMEEGRICIDARALSGIIV